MSDRVFFQMWGQFRKSLIAGHLFYVEQARKRLLSQFNDIEREADKAAEEWLEKSKDSFDPERHDPGDFYEAANNAAVEFGLLLSDMRDQTFLSVVAGMYHQWDKQLRDWLVRETQHWHRGSTVASKIWSVDFAHITDLLENIGWNIHGTEYHRMLDACRLVVNVYKHGGGKSLDDLKYKFPDYLSDPLGGMGVLSGLKYCDHTHLKVSESQFQAFADAIVTFWESAPENVFASKINAVPDWFEKAILKDQAGSQPQSN